MSWDKGFDFRATSAYVTDPTNCTYVLSDIYPTTRNGVTFGWGAAPDGNRDRDNTIDARLAGINFSAISSPTQTFQVDLPSAADYTITAALGDATNQNLASALIKDNTATVITLGPSAPTAQEFVDASNTTRTSASDWVSNNVSVTKTFATTTFNFVLGGAGTTSGASSWVVAHLFLSQAGAAFDPTVLVGSYFMGGFIGRVNV